MVFSDLRGQESTVPSTLPPGLYRETEKPSHNSIACNSKLVAAVSHDTKKACQITAGRPWSSLSQLVNGLTRWGNPFGRQ